MNIISIVTLAMFAAQLLLSGIILMVSINDFKTRRKNGYRSELVKKSQKWVRYAAVGIITSPVSIMILPVALLVGAFFGIKKSVQSTLHVINTEV